MADAGIGKKAPVCSSIQVKESVNTPKRFLTSFGMTRGGRESTSAEQLQLPPDLSGGWNGNFGSGFSQIFSSKFFMGN